MLRNDILDPICHSWGAVWCKIASVWNRVSSYFSHDASTSFPPSTIELECPDDCRLQDAKIRGNVVSHGSNFAESSHVGGVMKAAAGAMLVSTTCEQGVVTGTSLEAVRCTLGKITAGTGVWLSETTVLGESNAKDSFYAGDSSSLGAVTARSVHIKNASVVTSVSAEEGVVLQDVKRISGNIFSGGFVNIFNTKVDGTITALDDVALDNGSEVDTVVSRAKTTMTGMPRVELLGGSKVKNVVFEEENGVVYIFGSSKVGTVVGGVIKRLDCKRRD
jgi:cytoskeletal protein CcmA (bactofilin family)